MRDIAPFAQKLVRLTCELEEQFAESARLGESISANLALLRSNPAGGQRAHGNPS